MCYAEPEAQHAQGTGLGEKVYGMRRWILRQHQYFIAGGDAHARMPWAPRSTVPDGRGSIENESHAPMVTLFSHAYKINISTRAQDM